MEICRFAAAFDKSSAASAVASDNSAAASAASLLAASSSAVASAAYLAARSHSSKLPLPAFSNCSYSAIACSAVSVAPATASILSHALAGRGNAVNGVCRCNSPALDGIKK